MSERVVSGKHIARNTAFLYLRMLFVMLINVFSVRYVFKGLGVVDYGIFNVVAGLVTMFQSLSSIISSATLRFHSYAIGEGREERVSDIFTASFIIFALLALTILVLGECIGVWFINYQADIPKDRLSAANWVFQFSMLSFFVGLMTAPFSSLIFAYERMTLFSLISVAECFLKFTLAYCLVFLSGDLLILYGFGLFTIQVGSFLAYYISSKNGGGEYHFKRHVEKGLYKRMLSFSGWTLFSSSAGVGINQLVTMITNVFWGPVVNAARAIAFQVNSAMSSFTSNIIMAVKPPMIKSYAEGDKQLVNSYFQLCNKAVYYSLLLILLPLFFEMETVLDIWLEVNDSQTVLFCRLILIYSLILSLNNPISIVVQATGRIKAYSTFVEIPTLLCFPVTWAIYAMGGPAESAFYVMIIAVVLSHLIRLICLKRVFSHFSYMRYWREFVIPGILILIIVGLGMFLCHQMVEKVYPRLVISFLVCFILLAILCYVFGMTKREKIIVSSLLRGIISRESHS